MDRLHVIALAASTALAAGCGSDPRPAPRMAALTTTASDASPRPLNAPIGPNANAARQDTATPSSGSIHIDDKILRACGNLPAAHFAFDSSAVQPEAAATLDALARCFTTGALAGRGMLLTGHTDARGEVEYNIALGQRRAGSVAGYLAGRGMARGHLGTTSHGEFDATGTDEEGWARDRKVDVTLVE
jgi:peptidoglycan-associated lipoprotein